MTEHQKILYATIAAFELQQRLLRDDPTFNAWEFLSEKIGHKNESTLRKMCEQRTISNAAKLGYEDAMIIMDETNDYRLLHFMKNELRRRKDARTERSKQMNFFSEPVRSLEEES